MGVHLYSHIDHLAEALLAPDTSLEDVLFGMFTWLHSHPSETVLVSVNTESGPGRVNDARLQEELFNIFTDPRTRKVWLQDIGEVWNTSLSMKLVITPHSWAR